MEKLNKLRTQVSENARTKRYTNWNKIPKMYGSKSSKVQESKSPKLSFQVPENPKYYESGKADGKNFWIWEFDAII